MMLLSSLGVLTSCGVVTRAFTAVYADDCVANPIPPAVPGLWQLLPAQ